MQFWGTDQKQKKKNRKRKRQKNKDKNFKKRESDKREYINYNSIINKSIISSTLEQKFLL